MRQVKCVSNPRSVYGGKCKRDRHVPVSESWEKKIYEGEGSVYVDSIEVEGYIGEYSPVPETKVHRSLVSSSIRSKNTLMFMVDLESIGVDVRELVGAAMYELAVRLLVNKERVSSIASDLGVSNQTVYNRVYGPKRSVYSKLRAWYPRLMREEE